MATRSHRLWGPTVNVGTGPELVYTVPAGRVVICKSMRFVSNSDAAAVFSAGVGGIGAEFAVMPEATIAARDLVSDSLWWVLEQNDEIYVQASVAGALTSYGSGAILTL